jgi:hypothetical protein
MYPSGQQSLTLHSIMTAVAASGRRWGPGHRVPPGSVIELSDRDQEEIARGAHPLVRSGRVSGTAYDRSALQSEIAEMLRLSVID